MKSPKSLVAAMLLGTFILFSCKHKNEEVVIPQGDALIISFGGGYTAPNPPTKTLQIMEAGSYTITYSGGHRNIVALPADIHGKLKQYLSSFPQAAIKADPKKGNYSNNGISDDVYQTFSYVSSTETVDFRIDAYYTGTSTYMDGFIQNINKVITEYKLLP